MKEQKALGFFYEALQSCEKKLSFREMGLMGSLDYFRGRRNSQNAHCARTEAAGVASRPTDVGASLRQLFTGSVVREATQIMNT